MKMKIKVFTPNVNGKIEFAPAELEKLLNDTYEEGQRNCNCGSKITWTNPCISTTTSTSTNGAPATITLNNADAKEMSKHINEIIQNAAAKIDSDAFSKLAKELTF